MHNLQSNLQKIQTVVSSFFQFDVDRLGNFSFYPNRPNVSDIEIIALSITMEAIGISSENLLFSKLQSDYPFLFERFPNRRNFNKRRRKLQDKIDKIALDMAEELSLNERTFIVDSTPAPICRTVRAPKLRIMKDDVDFQPAYGYQAIDKTRYFGFKLHILVSSAGTIKNYILTPANVHDIKVAEDLAEAFIHDCNLLGDKAFFSEPVQLSLFESFKVKLKTPKKKNMKTLSDWNKGDARTRKMVETVFSQLEDHFLMKRNYAKSFLGYHTRLTSKITAHTMLQYLNMLANKPLNQIKHALAA